MSTSALREGRILLERVGRENPGVQGIKQMVGVVFFMLVFTGNLFYLREANVFKLLSAGTQNNTKRPTHPTS